MFKLETTRASVSFNIEQPTAWTVRARGLIVRGWCFGTTNAATAIRLRVQGMTFTGILGLARPDVKAAFPEAPEQCGFEIRAFLRQGRGELTLEAQVDGGEWVELARKPIRVRLPLLPAWFGGGDQAQLVAFQMPAHMAHAPRPLFAERWPRRSGASKLAPRLAIVTPSFGQARFLDETVRSVLDQSGATCEYVIQDGGSTDGSRDVIARHANRLHACASEPDAGQADAIAKGFARTVGEPDDVMAWINSDDFYLPGAPAYVADYFGRHPDVDVIYGHRVLVDENSQEIGRWFLPPHDDEILRLNDFVPQETMFWRRRIWSKVGGIDTSFRFAMDWDLLLRFQAAGAKIVRVPYFLACFRIHGAQKTAAQMEAIGQKEIDTLRRRTWGRELTPQEIEHHPRLIRYLRKSAWIEFLWRRFGIRA